MQSKMTFNDIKTMFDEKGILKVRVKKFLDQEGYLDKGMLANITSVHWNKAEHFLVIVLEFKEYYKFNKSLETPTYFNDKTGQYDLTATEAGYSPSSIEDFKENYYAHTDEDFFDCFEFVEDNQLFTEYMQAKGEGQLYTDWLEQEVLKLRTKV